MDLLAEDAYKLPSELWTDTDQEVLPDEIIAAYLHNNKITSNLKKSIIHAYHAPAMEMYIVHKHKLTDYELTHINWNRLQSYMTKLKMNQRSVSSKYIHGWLPMQAFLHKQMRTPSPYCPICTTSFLPETAAHILTCPHPSAIAACLTALDQCIKILCKSANTSPIILHCWDECLCRELGLPDKPQCHMFQRPPWIEAAVKEA